MAPERFERDEQFPPLPKIPTYIGACRCREYIMAYGRGGRCEHCGTGIEYVREDFDTAEVNLGP